MQRIAIVGGGFAGTMTAVQLVDTSIDPIEIILIIESETLNMGKYCCK